MLLFSNMSQALKQAVDDFGTMNKSVDFWNMTSKIEDKGFSLLSVGRSGLLMSITKRINAVKTARPVALWALFGSAFILSMSSFTVAKADNIDRLSVSIGAYDSFGGDNRATDFRIEYRPGQSIFWQLKPWVGGELTSDGGVFGGGGFLYDYSLGNNWLLTPSLGAGLYGSGSGKDLGNAVEFREQIEMGYQFDNASRLTGSVSHLSNWGMGNKNPGTDVFGLYFHIPMNWVKEGPGAN